MRLPSGRGSRGGRHRREDDAYPAGYRDWPPMVFRPYRHHAELEDEQRGPLGRHVVVEDGDGAGGGFEDAAEDAQTPG